MVLMAHDKGKNHSKPELLEVKFLCLTRQSVYAKSSMSKQITGPSFIPCRYIAAQCKHHAT